MMISFCILNSSTSACTRALRTSLDAIEMELTMNRRAVAATEFKLIFGDLGSIPDSASTVATVRKKKARTEESDVSSTSQVLPTTAQEVILDSLRNQISQHNPLRARADSHHRTVMIRGCSSGLWDPNAVLPAGVSLTSIAACLGLVPSTLSRHVNAAKEAFRNGGYTAVYQPDLKERPARTSTTPLF